MAVDKTRSKDFRYVYANAFALRLGDNDVTLILGMSEGGASEEILEEVAVVMTPRTLKIILNNLGNALKSFESHVGEIPVPPEKFLSSFDKMIEAGIARIETTGTAAVKKPRKRTRRKTST